MSIADIDNLTIAGGIKLFFDDGTGMRDLGFIIDVDLEPTTEELKYFTNRSGKRRLSKVFSIEEQIALKFKLNEPVINNMLAFFKGGDISTVGAGTDTVTDQEVVLSGTQLSSLGRYGISSVTVRQFLDAVYVYDGSAYTDNTAAADSVGGDAFTTLVDGGDILYLGKDTKFKEVYFDFATPGSYGAVVVEYWDGSAWQDVSDLGGAAAALAADGKMNWTLPTDWATKAINDYTGYFIKITATTPWTTPATVNHIRQNAVQNTDYIIDPGQVSASTLSDGRVGRLTGGFLVDGEAVNVSFTYTTWTSLTFPVAFADFQEGAARLEFHPSTGLQGNYHIPKCQLKPAGAMTLDDKKVLDVPMTLDVLDNYEITPTYPYGYWEALSES